MCYVGNENTENNARTTMRAPMRLLADGVVDFLMVGPGVIV
jgi:hypothetical protein